MLHKDVDDRIAPMNEMNRINVILVHGTWGRGVLFKRDVAVWCEPNSSFVTRLKTAILSNMAAIDDVTIQPFRVPDRGSVNPTPLGGLGPGHFAA
jgi:hypothetical protein